MSKHKVSVIFRHCLWTAHGKGCVYCAEPLPFGEMEADHIIPESYWSNPGLGDLLRKLELPPDFDLRSPANFLPSHSRCNRRKSADLFKLGPLSFYLTLAERKASQVQALMDQVKPREKRETLLAQLTEAIELGVITHMDIQRDQQHPDVLRLSRPVAFADGEETLIHSNQVEALLDRPVLMGGDPVFTATFGDSNGSRLEVRTCREYRSALAAGFYALTTYDIKSEAFLKTVNAVLTAAQIVRVPQISYMNEPFRGLADLDLLPVEALPRVAPDDNDRIAAMTGQTFRDLLERGEIKIVRISSQELSIEWAWGLMMREICRADFDGDGIEDILCECYCWAPEGTLGFGWTSIVSRASADSLFAVARI